MLINPALRGRRTALCRAQAGTWRAQARHRRSILLTLTNRLPDMTGAPRYAGRRLAQVWYVAKASAPPQGIWYMPMNRLHCAVCTALGGRRRGRWRA